ncbi:uncharacterized protein V6R79_010198 [Siganus canaliculatus]
MSTVEEKEEKQKRRALVLTPSSRTTNVSSSGLHGVNHGSRHTNSAVGFPSRRSFSLGGGSKVLEKSIVQTSRQTVRVFDAEGSDVTPQLLHQPDPAAAHIRASRFFLDEICAGSTPEPTTATGSFALPFSGSVLGSSRISSRSTIDSVNEEIEESLSKRDTPFNFTEASGKRDAGAEAGTETETEELIDVLISETDTISLLDIPNTVVSVDAEDADAITERNKQYVELCRNRMSSNKFMDRSMQTLNVGTKVKQVQSNSITLVDAGSTVTTWDMYHTMMSPECPEKEHPSPDPEKAKNPEAAAESGGGAEASVAANSTSSTDSSSSSFRDGTVVAGGAGASAEDQLQQIATSEEFRYSLLVMERSIMGNIFQPKLAAYRGMPVSEDPDRPLKPELEEDAETLRPPAAQRLWTFSCELSRGRSVSSMAWNKKNTDILAVGYGESGSRDQTPGLVCCWSLKNPTWPERVIHCGSAVTALDFSAQTPGQLVVGMQDGGVAIYNVQTQDRRPGAASSSRGCSKRHLSSVRQLRWVQQELSLTGEERTEALFSLAADGRIKKWFVSSKGLDCIELMKLKKVSSTKSRSMNWGEKKPDRPMATLIPGLCFDFHPADSGIYLVGSMEGLIHKGSCSNSQQFLETYRKHLSPVTGVTWSPLSPGLFLSCSLDASIQLWRQDQDRPLLSFACGQGAVRSVRWSPRRATVFGAISEDLLEIWDLNVSVLDPVLQQHAAAPGATMASLLFAAHSDCVLVGDSGGNVSVYQLHGLNATRSSQVDVLEDIVRSVASREKPD